MRFIMDRTYVKVFGVVVLLSLFSASALKADERHDKAKAGEAAKRAATKSEAFPAKYDETLKALEKEIEITALSADPASPNKNPKVGGAGNKFLADQIKSIKAYREKIGECSETFEKNLAKILDSYMTDLLKSLTTEIRPQNSAGTDAIAELEAGSKEKGSFLVSEKVVNTYTLQIRSLLLEKAKTREANKSWFETEDKKLTTALNNAAGALWGSQEPGKFRETIYAASTETTDKGIIAIVKSVATAKALLANKDEKVCKLTTSTSGTDDKAAPDNTDKKDDKKVPAKPEESPAPPEKVEDPTVSSLPAVIPPRPSGVPTIPPGGSTDPFGGAVGTAISDLQNGMRALQDALLQQQLENQRLNEEFARSAQDENNDALGKALQALGQQQAPSNRSANRENSDSRSPQISPSLDTGGKGGGQPNIPPPPPPPQPPPPFPMGALQPPPSPTINFPSYGDSKKWDEEPIRRPPVALQDPRSTGLLELLKMQQQMLLQSQQQRPMYGNVANINNVGGRLSAFGPRSSRRSSGRVTGNRMNGTASSSAQATMGANSRARTRAPR